MIFFQNKRSLQNATSPQNYDHNQISEVVIIQSTDRGADQKQLNTEADVNRPQTGEALYGRNNITGRIHHGEVDGENRPPVTLRSQLLTQHSCRGKQLLTQHSCRGEQLLTQHSCRGKQLLTQHSCRGEQLLTQHSCPGEQLLR